MCLSLVPYNLVPNNPSLSSCKVQHSTDSYEVFTTRLTVLILMLVMDQSLEKQAGLSSQPLFTNSKLGGFCFTMK